MAEGQILRNPVGIGCIHQFGAAETPSAPGTFALEQMPFAGMPAHYLAVGGDFEPLGHRLFRFDAFWTSHIYRFLKRTVTIARHPAGCKRDF